MNGNRTSRGAPLRVAFVMLLGLAVVPHEAVAQPTDPPLPRRDDPDPPLPARKRNLVEVVAASAEVLREMLSRFLEESQTFLEQSQRASRGAPKRYADSDWHEVGGKRQQQPAQAQCVLVRAAQRCDLGQYRDRRKPISVARNLLRWRQ